MLSMARIRFTFSPLKARAAIHWMVRQYPGVDLHTVLKACYFADKEHLNKHNRPIFGATYKAMRFGPVPIEIYEMTKSDPYWLPELETDRYPWRLDGFRLSLTDNSEPDMTVFSRSDIAALSEAFKQSRRLTFNGRTAVTHGRDWQAAQLGTMSYEDMLDDSHDKESRIEYLRESGRYIKL
jgi:hypothetical protein